MAPQFLFFSVVGMRYYGNHEFNHNDENYIKLEKDQYNIHDQNAIKVLLENRHVGYICTADNIKVKKFMNKNKNLDIELFSSDNNRAVFILSIRENNNKVKTKSQP
jgi:hypothetical protein